MAALRKKMKCTGTKPTSCACSPNKVARTACVPANKVLWDGTNSVGTWAAAAATCIKVTPDKGPAGNWSKHDFSYPSNYANTCADSGKEPGSFHCTTVTGQTHTFANGAGYNSKWDSQGWCKDKFCWVDPCACNRTDMQKSTWLDGYYSYSQCGKADSYSQVTCDGPTTEAGCQAKVGCKWADSPCVPQTGAEAMASLRKTLKCPSTAVPTNCACAANSEPKVVCAAANKVLWDGTVALGNWTGRAATCIKVTPDKGPADDWSKHNFTYPSNYANTCADAAKEPGSFHCTTVANQTHSFANGAGYNSKWDSQTWCKDKFCWVDPCACNRMDISKSTWLNGYYSYSQCGVKDSYSAKTCKATTKTACAAAVGCKWKGFPPPPTTTKAAPATTTIIKGSTNGAFSNGIGMSVLLLLCLAK